MKGTLIMLHGMTGSSDKMLPLAHKLVPSGWNVVCPEAKIIHPTLGGFAWWLRKQDHSEFDYVTQAYDSLTELIRELPNGPLIVGGFSQGGAIASMMMERNVQDRIVGLVLIGTMTINSEGLELALSKTWERPVVWMHGKNDKRVPFLDGMEHIKIFENAGWNVTKLSHEKGHMVDISKIDTLIEVIEEMTKS